MKTLRESISLDKKLTGQYRRLFRNLGLLILIIIALVTAAAVYFDKRQVEDLSRKLISSTAATIVEKLASFLETEDSNLRIAVEQVQMTRQQDDKLMEKLFFRLSPFLNQHQNASGILITELDAGDDYLGILKPNPENSEFLVRIRIAEEWGSGKVRLERWKNGQMLESWFRKDDFDPKTRPWFKKTLGAEENEIVATEPYLFYPSNKLGITISMHCSNGLRRLK